MKIQQILACVDQLAPFRLAESWDKTGLQIGDPNAEVAQILLCLEVTRDVVAEAARKKAGLILAHHPLIFEPLTGLRDDHYPQWLAAEMVRNGLALIVAHTNLDRSLNGVNAALAELIGLGQRRILLPGEPEKRYKYTVFAPVGLEAKIIEAIHLGGGGVIGEYDHCTFRSAGTGTYRGSDKSQPFLGAAGRLEAAPEFRIEALVPQRHIRSVHREVCAVHPYDEVAYDIYPLEQLAEEWGLGLIGMLPRRWKLKRFIGLLKRVLGIKAVQFIGHDTDIAVRTIACLGGSANSVIEDLRDKKFDVLLTGELSHHRAQEALDLGLNVVCVGHFASERPVSSYLSRILARQPIIEASGLKILVSESESDPLRVL